MKKQQISSIIAVFLFLIIFSIFYADEYIDFHNQKNEEQTLQTQLSKHSKDFDLSDLQKLTDTSLFITPSQQLQTTLVTQIKNAKKRIYLEAYMLTNRDIIDALLQVDTKGVDLKVMLEKNPYKAYNMNNKWFYILENAWINIIWSYPDNYALNHSKMLIIDDTSFVSTGNFTYSTFTKNRDIFISSKDAQLVSELVAIFHYDFRWTRLWSDHPNIITSPQNSRDKMTKLIRSAEKNIQIYFPYINDDDFKDLLIKKARSWVIIDFLVDKKSINSDTHELQAMQNAWMNIRVLKKSLHAKSILVDNKTLYVGSINFSDWSFDKNREIWLLLKDDHIITTFIKIFSSDFKKTNSEKFLKK